MCGSPGLMLTLCKTSGMFTITLPGNITFQLKIADLINHISCSAPPSRSLPLKHNVSIENVVV